MEKEKLEEIVANHLRWRRGEGVQRANLSDADLSAANLSDADLSAANLSAANLSAANLSDANLSDANLSDADLRDANLSAANLSAANLRDADLSAANLSAANLSDANLSDANLRAANLSDADLSDANLSDADLRDANLSGTVMGGANWGAPRGWLKTNPKLMSLVREAALQPGQLKMSGWHTCDTAHCLAGWAVHLSRQAGYMLESVTSPSVAGCMLLPDAAHLFYASNEEVLLWLDGPECVAICAKAEG